MIGVCLFVCLLVCLLAYSAQLLPESQSCDYLKKKKQINKRILSTNSTNNVRALDLAVCPSIL